MNGLTYPRRYETVTYPSDVENLEGWGGFQARILANPNGSERRHATRLFAEYIKKGAKVDAEDAYWQYVSPWIIEWNLEFANPDGSTTITPPPVENWESVYELEPTVFMWLALKIQIIYLPKVTAQTEPNPASEPDAGTTALTPPTPLPREKASKRSVSTLTA